MIEAKESSSTASASRSKAIKSIRNTSDFIGIWSLCNRTACRRARTCRGTSKACVRTYAPLVPEGARLWVLGLFWWKEQGATFDEALARMAETEEMQVFLDWMDKIGTPWRVQDGKSDSARPKDITHAGRR